MQGCVICSLLVVPQFKMAVCCFKDNYVSANNSRAQFPKASASQWGCQVWYHHALAPPYLTTLTVDMTP